jgi:hypothetical protein
VRLNTWENFQKQKQKKTKYSGQKQKEMDYDEPNFVPNEKT